MTFSVTVPKKTKPITPGEILVEEFLKPYGISQNALAKHIGWSPRKVSEICTGKRAITPETAMCLEDVFGCSAQFWMNLQLVCDAYKAVKKHKKKKMHPLVKKHMEGLRAAMTPAG